MRSGVKIVHKILTRGNYRITVIDNTIDVCGAYMTIEDVEMYAEYAGPHDWKKLLEEAVRVAKGEDLNPAATPQPAPQNQGVNVSAQVLDDLNQMIQSPMRDLIIEDVEARIKFGIQKYGQPLMSEDERDDKWDAYQEALDLMMYSRKAIINNRKGYGYVYLEARKLAFTIREIIENE